MKRLLAVLAGTTLGITGCVSGDGNPEKDTITIAAVDGWDDTVSSSLLWKAVLEDQGYDVNIEYADVSVDFLGVSDGDYDLYLGAWLPNTHGEYFEEYGDNMENLGAWNNEAVNAIAVNEDAPIDSLDELAAHADEFDNRIIGIEPGAGLTQLVENDVIPEYGLEDFDFVTSSTPAMLAEVESKINSGENIAVTLWQPHWSYASYPLKNLEDPELALGEPEEITALAKPGFTEEFPEVAEWIKEFDMDMDVFASLQDALFSDNDPDKYEERLDAWMADNQEWVDQLTA
ncbi:MAG: glycine betaine ABC transporter substrate-binding protein [Canibacter sp.]